MTPERLRELATGAVLGGGFLTDETQEVAYALFAYADLLKAQAPPEAREPLADVIKAGELLQAYARAIRNFDYAIECGGDYREASNAEDAARDAVVAAMTGHSHEPEGWRTGVHEDSSQVWLTLRGPEGQQAAFAVPNVGIRAEILRGYRAALTKAGS